MSNIYRNSNDQYQISNNDAKVYIGNVPTDYLTDQELLQFFKPFGQISDIRVYKGYLFVQYENIHDAKRLIKQGENCLILKGHKLDVLPAMNQNLRTCHSSNYQPPKKRFTYENRDDQSSYTILKGPDQSVDCRIILVNYRQREYGEEISSYLQCHDLVTSIILLREDLTLTEAIENAKNDGCLYAIIVMPIHQQKHTASFHILHGQNQEYRNITLEDGYHILLENYSIYKENKLPLSMLLCLLADGRQLKLDEIDRILVYLLEKKSKMLTLPQGILPPLPSYYANINKESTNNSSTMFEQILMKSSNHFQENENDKQIQSTSNQHIYSSLPNSAAADAAAAIFQAYSQFNGRK